MKHSKSETDRGVAAEPEALPASQRSDARESRTATPEATSESSPAASGADRDMAASAAPLPILAIVSSTPQISDLGGAAPEASGAPAPVTPSTRSAMAEESGEFLAAHSERALRESSSEATKVGLGAAVATRPSAPKEESATLLGIPGADRHEPSAQPLSTAAPVPAPPGPPSNLPRFDDNPLIAVFSPGPTRRRDSALEGFVPLVSTARALGDNVTLIRPEPRETALHSSARAARSSVPGRRTHWRTAGVFAGLFALVSIGIAWRAAHRQEPPRTEIRTVTAGESSAPNPAAPATPAAGDAPPVAGLPAIAPPAIAPPETAALGVAPPETPAGNAPGTAAANAPSTAAANAPSAAAANAPGSSGGPLDEAPAGEPRHLPNEGPEATEPVPLAIPDLIAEPRPGDSQALPPSDDVELAAASLEDEQLAALFALETRSETYRCPAAESGSTTVAPTSTDSQLTLWRDWRRAQLEGDVDGARNLLCELLARSPSDARIHSELASLALRWGDARGAASAAEAGLELRPGDASLSQLLGDAWALLGDAERSRQLWRAPTRAGKRLEDAQLVDYYEGRGKAAAERDDFAKARTFYRRAVVLSHGGLPSSVGLSRSLSGLGQARAALGWARRAALAAPENAKFQMAYGDALYWAGDAASALRTWGEAARSNPSPALRRRLSRGHP